MNSSTCFALEQACYSAKQLEPDDADVLQPLYEQCTDFALLVDGHSPSASAARDEFLAVPEGKTVQDKFIFGLFDEHNVLLGMLETIRHYPDDQSWYVGLMMLTPEQRGKGLGSRFYRAFEQWVTTLGAQQVFLSVVEENQQGYRFWKKLGFEVTRKTPPKQFGNKVHTLYVMRRATNATS